MLSRVTSVDAEVHRPPERILLSHSNKFMLAQVCTVLWQLRGNGTHLRLHLIFKSILGCVGSDGAAVIIVSPADA